jgi:hypothetical protein
MTYRELFELALKERITAGGEIGQMVRLVNAYQGSDVLARMEEFSIWLENDRFDCGRCGSAFWAASTTHSESDEVLCASCHLGYFIRTAEPMPGWNRTWSR